MPDETTLTAPAADDTDAPAASGTASDEATDPTAKIIDDYRRRQSGAEKARLEAERKLNETLARLEALEKGKSAKPSDAGPDFDARLKEIEERYAKQAEDMIAKVTGDALNARFPAARAKFPEVTDTVKLAELEAMFTETEIPPPVGNNPARTQAPATKRVEDMTIAEREEYIRTAFDKSIMGL